MPRSPGGVEVARLSVRVVPDTSTLLPEIREDLEKIERRLRMSVEVEPDLDGFEEKIESERQQQRRRPVEVPVDPLTEAFATRLNRDVKAIAKSIDVGIPIEPATEGFREELNARLRAVQSTLRDIRVGVDVSEADKAKLVAEIKAIQSAADFAIEAHAKVDKVSLVKAEVELDAFRARQSQDVEVDVRVNRDVLGGLVGSLGSGLKNVLGKVSSIAKFIALWGVGGVSLLSLLPGLISGLGAISALAVGLAAILPGALFATVGVLGTLILGFKGLGGAIFETGKRQEEALASLSPAAKAFALEFKGIFDGVQQEIQERLFTGLAPRVKAALDALVPVALDSMRSLTDGLNEVFAAALGAISTDKYAEQFRSFFADTTVLLQALAVAVGPLIDAFATLGTHVADVVFPRIAGAMVDLSTRFQAFIDRIANNGDLDQFLTRVLDGFTSLGRAFENIGSALTSVFDAASGGQSFDDILLTFELFTKSISVFLDSPEGAAGLREFFDSLRSVSAALGPVVGALFSVLATKVVPIIASLITGLAPGVVTFLQSLGEALANLEPVAEPLGAAFGAIVVALTPLLGPLGQALATVLTGIAQGLVAAAPTLTAVATQLGSVLTTLAQQLGPQIPAIVQAFAQAFVSATLALPAVVDVVNAIIPLIPQLLILGLQALPLLNQGMALLVSLAPVLIPLFQSLLPLIQAFVALLTPISNMILGFQSVTAGLGQSLDGLTGSFVGLISPIYQVTGGLGLLTDSAKKGTGAVLDFATRTTAQVLTATVGLTEKLTVLAAAFGQRVVEGTANAASWISRIAGILGVFGNITVSGAIGWLSRLGGALSDLVSGAISTATNAFLRIITSIQSINNAIASAIGWLDRLFSKLKNVPGIGALGALLGTIPHFAEGGMTLGPQIAVMGDNPSGREVALPLNSRSTISALSAALRQAQGAGLDAVQSTGVDLADLPPIVSDVTLLLDGKKVAEVVNVRNLEDSWR